MIVYTTRGGVSAVIWTDVVQMFVYVAGALVVFVALLQQIDGGWSAVVAAGEAARQVPRLRLRPRSASASTRSGPGLFGGVALTLATHGTDQFLVQRLLSREVREERRDRADPERLHRLRAVRAVPGDRRRALRLLPADAAAAAARQQRRGAAALRRHVALARRRRLHRRGDRRRGAVALDQRARGDDGQRLLPEVRAARRRPGDADARVEGARRSSGASRRSASRSARSGSTDRCSMPASRVLSLAAGPVLGAFLVGVLTTRVGARAMLAGMAGGVAVLAWVWWTGAAAWTWYAFIGSSVTFAAALAAVVRASRGCHARFGHEPSSCLNASRQPRRCCVRRSPAARSPPRRSRSDAAARPLWRYATGRLTYDADAPPVDDETVFDLASLTKVIATTTLAMRAVDDGRLEPGRPRAQVAARLERRRSRDASRFAICWRMRPG